MGLKKRIEFVVKSQFNDWVTRAENPEKILNQAVEEMDEGLEAARGRIALLRYRVEEQNKHLAQLTEQIEYWQGRAVDCVRKAMEENARDAVGKRRMLESEQRALSAALARDKVKLGEYEERLSGLGRRVRDSKSKRGLILKDLPIRRGPSGGGSGVPSDAQMHADEPFWVFKRIEERVEREREFSEAAGEREENLFKNENKTIDEEIENIKKTLSKGGSKK